MNRLTRQEPMNDFVSLRQAMDRLLEDSFVRPYAGPQGNGEGRTFQLPVDAYVTENEVVVMASTPGVDPEKVDITIEGDTLTIRGEVPALKQNENWVLQERRHGPFYRSLTLNVPVQADKASASFENGVLTLTLPKAESIKPRQIKVNTK